MSINGAISASFIDCDVVVVIFDNVFATAVVVVAVARCLMLSCINSAKIVEVVVGVVTIVVAVVWSCIISDQIVVVVVVYAVVTIGVVCSILLSCENVPFVLVNV